MRILIYGLNFAPEITGVGKFTGEMAAYLSAQGHEIKVVTSFPYYPAWKIGTGARPAFYASETWAPSGNAVRVVRCPLYVPAHPTGWKRVLHLLSFALSSLPACLVQAFWKPDVVMNIAPAIFTAPTALLTARLCGARAWLHVQDFEIGAAWSLGMVKSGRRLRGLVEKFFFGCMRKFDRVSTISDRMRSALAAAGVSPDRLSLLPNWVDVEAVRPVDSSNGFHRELDIPEAACVVLFSGSMTRKQSLPTLVEAAWTLSDRADIHFVLCGEGAVKMEIQTMAAGLPNIHFLPLQPAEKFNHLMNLADIHVLPQMSASADLVLPSKLTAMLASGRPVVATANADTALGGLLAGAGLLTRPEDPAALAAAIRSLADRPGERAAMGRNARAIAEREFSSETILSTLNASLVRFITV